ncbi:MAG: pyruvate dehydrogenase [Armatimonadetes bacterium]|nr:pyruvate dehydrogenase [Armatimonadota bacterium]
MPKEIESMPVFQKGEIHPAPIALFRYAGSVASELADGLTRDEALAMYDCMCAIRLLEERIAELKSGRCKLLPRWRFVGATHLSIGQEAVAVGAIQPLNHHDHITSTHRGHGHSIAKGFFALREMGEGELRNFVEGAGYGERYTGPEEPPCTEGEAAEAALQMHLNRTMSELFGKEAGYCRGRGGGMHIADFNVGHLGANAIVGGSYAIATGAAMANLWLGEDRTVLCLVGDGATNNGIAHEAMNMACMDQIGWMFDKGLPIIYLVENNQYGMTGKQAGEVTGIEHLAQRGAGYNRVSMRAEAVNGMDPLAVRDAVRRAVEACKAGEGPILLECLTYRYMGHSLSDDGTAYRSAEEKQAWVDLDPTVSYPRALAEAGVATEAELQERRERMLERIDKATLFASDATEPDPKTMYEGLFADTTSESIDASLRTPDAEILAETKIATRDRSSRILYRHAVAEAIMEEMIRDRRVVLFGEDVAEYGGAFGATRGLFEIFGRKRVFNTAISEAAICGAGAGMAMAGMRPIVELMYIDFILMAMDQVGNQCAKARYMFGGKATVPMVIRTSVGGGKGYAGQHSQSLEAVATMIPGLKVVAPSTAQDVKGLLKAAVRDDNPVVFIEHQNLYVEKGEVPEGEYTIPLGVGAIRREGTDVTVVAYSAMMLVAEKAAELAAEEGISVELVDPRTLIPLDEDLIVNSVRKTGRAVLLSQAPATGCFAEHIAHVINGACFGCLKAPVRIVAAYDVPPPMAQSLETENLPSPEKVLGVLRELALK